MFIKKISMVLTLLLNGSLMNLYGGPCTAQSYQSYQYTQIFENQDLDTILENGSVLISHTTVADSVSVNGSLLVKYSNLNTLQVSGEVKVENSTINLVTTVNGALNGQQTIFDGLVSVASEKTIFKNCELNRVTIRAISGKPVTQVLELSGNTTVKGDIIFEMRDGVVTTTKDVTILGNIVNGVVVSK